ncbi:SRPBCC family protein [Actinophytocola sp.]|uniref:SRPBCC family protein n=1 Tax=Actinophytocola sp. TaxID=1872138 RepID=UPI003D6B21ED
MATETLKKKAKNAAPRVDRSPLTGSLRSLAETVTTRAATSLTDKITSTAGRLTEYSNGGGGAGLLSAVTGTEPGARRKAVAGAVKGALTGVTGAAKDKISSALTGGDGKLKVTNIVEQIDVGVPVDLAYDQWTRFTDFPGFMKKVEHVEQVADEKLRWQAQILWSHRTWESTIIDQVPGERIVWRSEAEKGHADGTVTFHELAPDLTRIMLVIEYHPKGFFEQTGNLWRAQGRRVRLELKHFQRHVMTHSVLHPDEIEGWGGEIHDGEVVDQAEAEAEGEGDQAEDEEDQAEGEAEEPAEEDEADEEAPRQGRRRRQRVRANS